MAIEFILASNHRKINLLSKYSILTQENNHREVELHFVYTEFHSRNNVKARFSRITKMTSL